MRGNSPYGIGVVPGYFFLYELCLRANIVPASGGSLSLGCYAAVARDPCDDWFCAGGTVRWREVVAVRLKYQYQYRYQYRYGSWLYESESISRADPDAKHIAGSHLTGATARPQWIAAKTPTARAARSGTRAVATRASAITPQLRACGCSGSESESSAHRSSDSRRRFHGDAGSPSRRGSCRRGRPLR